MFSKCFRKSSTNSNESISKSLVYRNDSLGAVHEGVCFTFAGSMIPNSKRFSIYLALNNANNDIALLVNPYRSQNCIVCSSRVWGTWITKQQFCPLPFSFKLDSDFYIQIFITDICYMIAINGHHIADYNHQISTPREVRCIEVKGDVDNLIVLRGMVVSYPDRMNKLRAKSIPLVSEKHQRTRSLRGPQKEKLPIFVPFVGHLLPGLFKVGRCLRVDARISKNLQEFSISFQKGQAVWPQPVVAFKFAAKYGLVDDHLHHSLTCSNAYFNGQWLKETCRELAPSSEFSENKLFNMYIVLREHAYEVYLNRRKITEFVHRILPNFIDTVYIKGDIELRGIELNHRYIEDFEILQNKNNSWGQQIQQKK